MQRPSSHRTDACSQRGGADSRNEPSSALAAIQWRCRSGGADADDGRCGRRRRRRAQPCAALVSACARSGQHQAHKPTGLRYRMGTLVAVPSVPFAAAQSLAEPAARVAAAAAAAAARRAAASAVACRSLAVAAARLHMRRRLRIRQRRVP